MDKIIENGVEELKKVLIIKENNDKKIEEIKMKIKNNVEYGFQFNNKMFALDRESEKYKYLNQKKLENDNEIEKLKQEKENLTIEWMRGLASIRNGLNEQIKIGEEKIAQLDVQIEELRTRLLENYEIENWNAFFNEDLDNEAEKFDKEKSVEELKELLRQREELEKKNKNIKEFASNIDANNIDALHRIVSKVEKIKEQQEEQGDGNEQQGKQGNGYEQQGKQGNGNEQQGKQGNGNEQQGKQGNGYEQHVGDIINEGSIKISYKASLDKYLITNKDTNDVFVRNYSDLQVADISEIEEKYGLQDEFVECIDPAIVAVLEEFDEIYGTDKTNLYLKNATSLGKSKEEKQEDMKDASIDIMYNLRGLYKNTNLSQEDRKVILETANIAKRNGIASVKKGIITTIREVMDNISSKFSNIELPHIKKPRLISAKKESNLLDGLNRAAEYAIKRSELGNKIHAEVDVEKAKKEAEKKAKEQETQEEEMGEIIE